MTDGEKKQKNNGNKKAPAEKPGRAPRWALVLMSKLPIKWRTIANRRPRASLSNIPAKWFTGLTGKGRCPKRAPHRTERTEPLQSSGLLNGGGRSRKTGVVFVELFTELLDFLLGRHVGGGGLPIVVGVPRETEKVARRGDAGLQ